MGNLKSLLQSFVTGGQTSEEEWNQTIVEAIINALLLKQQLGDSIKSFEEWLNWARDFVITDQRLKDTWPTSWSGMLDMNHLNIFTSV